MEFSRPRDLPLLRPRTYQVIATLKPIQPTVKGNRVPYPPAPNSIEEKTIRLKPAASDYNTHEMSNAALARCPELALKINNRPLCKTTAPTLSTITRYVTYSFHRLSLASSNTIAAPFSPIIVVGAFILPLVIEGMIDASITRRRSMPRTFIR